MQEAVDPRLNLSLAIRVPGSLEPLSVRASMSIPGDLIEAVAAEIRTFPIFLPVAVDEVVVPQILPGVDVVVTNTLPEY